MADRNATIDAAGCLARVLTTLGIIWIGFVILGGLGILSEAGWSGGFLAGLGGSILPGLMLLVAGRAVKRRAVTLGGESPGGGGSVTPPIIPGRRVPPSTPVPAQKTPIPFPVVERPSPKPVATPSPPPPEPVEETRSDVMRRLEETFSPPEGDSDVAPSGTAEPGATPARKTSQEMIEEARRKWGTGSRRPPES
jgi:hypothetical protein